MCGSWLHSRHLRSAPQRLQLLSRHCAWWEDRAGRSASGLGAGGHVQHNVRWWRHPWQDAHQLCRQVIVTVRRQQKQARCTGGACSWWAAGRPATQPARANASRAIAGPQALWQCRTTKSTPRPNPTGHAGRCTMKAAQWWGHAQPCRFHRAFGSIPRHTACTSCRSRRTAGSPCWPAGPCTVWGSRAAGQQGRWAVERWRDEHQVAQGGASGRGQRLTTS